MHLTLRILRHAFACALLALAFASSPAGARPISQSFSGPPASHWHPMTDDSGRAWRGARSVAGAAWGGGSAIIAEAMRFLGGGNPTGTGPHNWCADYASMVLRQSGHRPLASRMAYSALSYGPHVSNPQPGDLIVLHGHVGFFAGWDRGQVVMVSGNWSKRVSRALISARSVIAFVRVA